VVEHYEVADAEDLRGIPQLTRSSVAQSRLVLPGTMLTVREAEQRHPDTTSGASREQTAARQRLVVGVREDR
jgi:hypothetical protein